MITNKVLAETIREASVTSGSEMMLKDASGRIIANTFSDGNERQKNISSFAIENDEQLLYTLYVYGGENELLAGKMTSLQIRNLYEAYDEKIDKNSFYSKLIAGELQESNILPMAKKLHINGEGKKCVFVVEPLGNAQDNTFEIIKELFNGQSGDVVLSKGKGRIILIKAISEDNETEETAKMLVDMISAEAMQSVKVAYGNISEDLRDVQKSYREAKMALEIGQIFYFEKAIIAYSALGIGRLIYQLPMDLCQLYVKEIFGDDIPEELDDEMLVTINKFFENNLNVSETSRQLSMHRNTLLYRIDKVQKSTGLDIRIFDDALALKIALMVVNYIRYFDKKEI